MRRESPSGPAFGARTTRPSGPRPSGPTQRATSLTKATGCRGVSRAALHTLPAPQDATPRVISLKSLHVVNPNPTPNHTPWQWAVGAYFGISPPSSPSPTSHTFLPCSDVEQRNLKTSRCALSAYDSRSIDRLSRRHLCRARSLLTLRGSTRCGRCARTKSYSASAPLCL